MSESLDEEERVLTASINRHTQIKRMQLGLSTLSQGSGEINISLSAQVMTIDLSSSASPANRASTLESRADGVATFREKSNRKPLRSDLQGHVTFRSSSHLDCLSI